MSEGAAPSTTTASVLATCPVCRARPRGARTCPRCGADLAPIQRCVLEAWRMRIAARAALLDDRIDDGLRLARASVLLHATPAGRRLEALAQLLVRAPAVPIGAAEPEPAGMDSRSAPPALDAPPPDPLSAPVPERVASAGLTLRPRSQSIPWWRRLFLRRRP